MRIRTMLIDDEPLAIAELEAMLKVHDLIEVVGKVTDPLDALKQISELKPQLLFLDINMPGKGGFELLEELDEVPEVIFVTAYDQFAIKAFDVNALDYILKPINTERLSEALSKVYKRMLPVPSLEKTLTIDKRIFIKDGEQCFFVPVSEIFLIESVGNYARVFYQDKKPLLHRSLNYLDERLPADFFFRASRQHIVNTNFIKHIVPYFNSTLQVELMNGIKVDISQRQSVKFKDKMGV